MDKKYQDLLDEARNNNEVYFYQKTLKAVIADPDFDNQEYVETVLFESVKTIVSNDQKKTMKRFAKELIKDKSVLKNFNAVVKDA